MSIYSGYYSLVIFLSENEDYWLYIKSLYKRPYRVVAEKTKGILRRRLDRLLAVGHRRRGYEE